MTNVWGVGGIHRGEYSRHSVDEDVEYFCGWRKLLEMIGAADRQPYKDLILFGFATGGRITEVLQLRTSMFNELENFEPRILEVRNMPLVKRYEKTGEYTLCLKCQHENPKGTIYCEKCKSNLLQNGEKKFITETIESTRKPFPIFLDTPIAKMIVHSYNQKIRDKQQLIFESPWNPGKPYTRQWAYWVLQRIGKKTGIELYPHRLRSERASHLATKLQKESLLEWFSWENWNTAKRYSKKGARGLALEMGAKEVN